MYINCISFIIFIKAGRDRTFFSRESKLHIHRTPIGWEAKLKRYKWGLGGSQSSTFLGNTQFGNYQMENCGYPRTSGSMTISSTFPNKHLTRHSAFHMNAGSEEIRMSEAPCPHGSLPLTPFRNKSTQLCSALQLTSCWSIARQMVSLCCPGRWNCTKHMKT